MILILFISVIVLPVAAGYINSGFGADYHPSYDNIR